MNDGLHPSYRRRLRKERLDVPGFDFGNALLFDGVNDRAEIAVGVGSGQLPPVGASGSIALWFLHTKTNLNGFFEWGAAGNSLGMVADNTGTQLRAFVPGDSFIISNPGTTVNNWNHVVISWRNLGVTTQVDICLNGRLAVSRTSAVAWPTGGSSLYLGRLFEASRQHQGKLDEICVYDRPLDTPEVYGLYGSGLGSRFVPVTGLLARWSFDETSGTTAFDSSGNGRHLTLVNGPTFTTHHA